jgi:type IV pilus assembly protein PilM
LRKGGGNLKKKYLSIDFGTQNIKIAVGNLYNGSFIIEKLDMINTPEDSYKDGKILAHANLSKAIKDLIDKNWSKCKDVAITLNSTNIITREITLPNINTKEIDSMIRYEIMQQMPIEMEHYIIEYRILEEFEEDNVKKNRIFVAAVPKVIVESFFNFIKKMGLRPVSMNINPNALSRLITDKAIINNSTSIDNDTICILDFGYTFISISIISRGNLTFSRMINQGGKDLDIAIASAYRVTEGEAEQIKVKFNLDDANKDIYNEYQASMRIINKWLQDTRRMIQFYENRSSTKISKLYVYGGVSNMIGLIENAKSTFNLPVEPISGISSIKLSKNIDTSVIDIKNYLNAIGAIPKSR